MVTGLMSSGSAVAPSTRSLASERIVWNVIGAAEQAGSLVLLILLSPFLLLTGCAIAMLSRRSPLVAHRRLGQSGRTLWTLKFRTMWPSPASRAMLIEPIAEEPDGDFKPSDDPRVTSSFARFCRRYSIDEAPQLIHVVSGAMQWVGPRPMTAGELERHYSFDAPLILGEKPGITGLWQVSGRSRLSYAQRREMDLHLIRNRTAMLYARILLLTVVVVLRGKDGW
jgi:exopolysaccharide production protein ExoY